jgi:hemerythrin-like domain-containing protein
MADVFEVLGKDHEDTKQLLDALEASPGVGGGATESVVIARSAAVMRLVIDASGHEAAEEQYFWPVVRSRLADGNELADRAITQETHAKRVLNRLDKTGGADPEFDDLVRSFIPECRAHIEFEETRVWPPLRATLSPAEAEELGGKVARFRRHGPTRPHPHTPPSPRILATAGTVAAAVDRLRDAIDRRDEPGG